MTDDLIESRLRDAGAESVVVRDDGWATLVSVGRGGHVHSRHFPCETREEIIAYFMPILSDD